MTTTVTKFRRQFGQWMARVERGHVVTITRYGVPLVVVMPITQYEAWVAAGPTAPVA